MIYFFSLIRILFASAITFILLVFIVFYFFQHKLIFFPHSSISLTPQNYNMQYEPIKIILDDKNYISAWFIEGDKSKPVILFFNGNGGNKSHHIERALFFKRLGFSSMLFDYRGYGDSQGKISEKNFYEDGKTCLEYLISVKKFTETEIIIWGWSLGGAVAANTAQNRNLKHVVLESTFTNIVDVGNYHYPFLPVKTASKYKFETSHYLKNVSCPVLIMHSTDDEIIPFFIGKKLFSEIEADKKNLFESIHGSHNESFYISQSIIENKILKIISSD